LSEDFVKKQGGFATEQNFEQAAANCHRLYGIPSLDSQTTAVLKDERARETNINENTDKFWLAVAGLNRFVSSEGHGYSWLNLLLEKTFSGMFLYFFRSMPCSTNIPDMMSETHFYVRLKKMWHRVVPSWFETLF